MKKLFFTFSVIAFSAVGVFAQGISGGLKLGANFANQKISSDIDLSLQNRTSLHAGFFLTIMVSETFGVQPELMYSSVGSKFDIDGVGTLTEKIDYLTLPVMFRYNPVPIFNIHAGPQFGFLLSAKEEFDGDSQDIKEDLESLDLGLGVGVGVDLPMGLGFSARYVLGFSNIAKEADGDDKLTNTVIQLSVSYKLFGGN